MLRQIAKGMKAIGTSVTAIKTARRLKPLASTGSAEKEVLEKLGENEGLCPVAGHTMDVIPA